MRITPAALAPVLLAAAAALASACDARGNEPGIIELQPATDGGSGQTGPVGQPLPLRLRTLVTEGGVPVEGLTVGWSTADGGSVATDGPTGADGIAEAVWTLGRGAGEQSARAVLEGAPGSPVLFTATAEPGPPARLLQLGRHFAEGEIGTSLWEPLAVMVRDRFENPIAGVPVAWTVESGDAAVAPAGPITDEDGISHAAVTLGAITGPSTILAAADGLTGSPARFVATARLYVYIEDNSFSPAELTVTAGTTVTWYRADAMLSHNVVPEAEEPARSGDPTSLELYSYTFATPGTYRYYCQVHGAPLGGGMSGVVHVVVPEAD